MLQCTKRSWSTSSSRPSRAAPIDSGALTRRFERSGERVADDDQAIGGREMPRQCAGGGAATAAAAPAWSAGWTGEANDGRERAGAAGAAGVGVAAAEGAGVGAASPGGSVATA